MKILIVGCGKIGGGLIRSLADEGHDIVAIDSSAEVLERLTNVYDVMSICGNGADSDILLEAGVENADLFVAVTAGDELNMLACFLAKKLGAKYTIARIRNPEYNDRSLFFLREKLELSGSLNPEQLAAQELFNLLKFPSAVKVETFSRRYLEMAELKLKAESVLDGVALKELKDRFGAQVLVCCVGRGEEVFIPGGDFRLKSGDRIGVTAPPAELSKFLAAVGILKKKSRSVMLIGGGRTAHYLAEKLITIGCNVTVIEQDEARAAELCEAIPKAVVLLGDGAQQELLIEAGLRSTDALVALTGMDEENILLSVFAASQGVEKSIAKVNRDEFISMADGLGVDTVVSPERLTSDVLVSYVRALQNSMGSNVEMLYQLMGGKAEALEFNVVENERFTGIPLKDLKLKDGILIAGILRERKPITPSGEECILAGDKVVVVAAGDKRLSDLSDILK